MSSVGIENAQATSRPRLLDQLRQSALARFGRPEPADRHVEWVRRFILFHTDLHQDSLRPPSMPPGDYRGNVCWRASLMLSDGVVCVCVGEARNANHFRQSALGRKRLQPQARHLVFIIQEFLP